MRLTSLLMIKLCLLINCHSWCIPMESQLRLNIIGFNLAYFLNSPINNQELNTIVYDTKTNRFLIKNCKVLQLDFKSCHEINVSLFKAMHLDPAIISNSFAHGLLIKWFNHKSFQFWINQIFIEDLIHLNAHYYTVDFSALNMKNDFLIFKAQHNNGLNVSDEGLFSNEFFPLKFALADGPGFWATKGVVFFPNSKPVCSKFSYSQEPIDFIAIINHELGHTRFGAPDSVSLIGEALVVKNIENPVRIFDGFSLRTFYYSKSFKKVINIFTLKELEIQFHNSISNSL